MQWLQERLLEIAALQMERAERGGIAAGKEEEPPASGGSEASAFDLAAAFVEAQGKVRIAATPGDGWVLSWAEAERTVA